MKSCQLSLGKMYSNVCFPSAVGKTTLNHQYLHRNIAKSISSSVNILTGNERNISGNARKWKGKPSQFVNHVENLCARVQTVASCESEFAEASRLSSVLSIWGMSGARKRQPFGFCGAGPRQFVKKRRREEGKKRGEGRENGPVSLYIKTPDLPALPALC